MVVSGSVSGGGVVDVVSTTVVSGNEPSGNDPSGNESSGNDPSGTVVSTVVVVVVVDGSVGSTVTGVVEVVVEASTSVVVVVEPGSTGTVDVVGALDVVDVGVVVEVDVVDSVVDVGGVVDVVVVDDDVVVSSVDAGAAAPPITPGAPARPPPAPPPAPCPARPEPSPGWASPFPGTTPSAGTGAPATDTDGVRPAWSFVPKRCTPTTMAIDAATTAATVAVLINAMRDLDVARRNTDSDRPVPADPTATNPAAAADTLAATRARSAGGGMTWFTALSAVTTAAASTPDCTRAANVGGAISESTASWNIADTFSPNGGRWKGVMPSLMPAAPPSARASLPDRATPATWRCRPTRRPLRQSGRTACPRSTATPRRYVGRAGAAGAA